ncbi:MAG TPA: YCF48-related protein [Bryobacteraceae bacterium]|nr:YCF48-related protein [Bryobacteraceae bacterium]
MKFTIVVWFAAIAAAQSWSPQESGTTASLRGVSAVSASVVWASGSNGTFLRTTDGGAHWRSGKVPGASDLDFRAIQAIDENVAAMLSAGAGEKSRVYKTGDGGGHWELMYTNPDPDGFFDAIAFWDDAHGILLGDPVKKRFVVMTTADGGGTWKRQKGPEAQSGEGAFAASNTCLFARGTREAWIGTGGARVFHTTDAGETWSVAKTPIRKDSSSAGIFSIAFSNKLYGVAVGGDYHKPAESSANIAITADGGKEWKAPPNGPGGFRSAVVYVPEMKAWIATGTSGSDISLDGGETWKQFDQGNYNAISFAAGAGWAVGPMGAVAKWRP